MKSIRCVDSFRHQPKTFLKIIIIILINGVIINHWRTQRTHLSVSAVAKGEMPLPFSTGALKNARVENAGAGRRDGKCRSGKVIPCLVQC